MSDAKKRGYAQALDGRLAWCHELDTIKTVWVPFQTLGKEMIAKLPSMAGSILVLCDAGLLIAVLKRLQADGLTGDQVTFVCHTERLLLLGRELGVETILVCYNDLSTWLKARLMGLKFDIVVGNPPYAQNTGAKNVKLWQQFSVLALESCTGIVAFVTPNNVISQKGVNGFMLRNRIKDLDFGFIEVRDHNPPVFVGVGVSTCHWIVQKGVSDQVEPVVVLNGVEFNPLVDSIIEKMLGSRHKRLDLRAHLQPVKKEDLTADGNIILFSGDKISFTKKDLSNDDELKLVFPFSASYHNQFVTRHPLGMLNMYFKLEDEAQADRIRSFTLSKLYKFFASKYKKTSGFTPAVKNSMLPAVDTSRTWTDQELYTHFSLTQDEIDLIERTVK
jgi:hypothetical protein